MMRKLLRGFGWALPCLFALYCWLGFLAAPALGLFAGNQLLARYTTEAARLQRLEFNPLTLELRLWQLQIGDAEPELALAAARAQLDWSNLLQGRIHVREIQLQQPYAHIELDAERQLTLLQLFDLPENTNDKPAEPARPFPLTLEQVQIEQARLSYADQGLQQPVTIELGNINFQLREFTLDRPDPASFDLQLEAGDGTRIQTRGEFSLQTLSSQGQLEVSELQLASWWPYVREQLPLHLQQGSLELSSDYQLELQPQVQIKIRDLNLQLDNLALTDADQQPLLDAASVQLKQASFDLAEQQVSAATINVQQLQAPLLIDAQGRLNWEKIAPPANTSVTDAPAAPDNNSGMKLADIPWHLSLQQLSVQNSKIGLQMHNQPGPVSLELHAINLQVNNFDSRSDEPVDIRFDSRLDQQGTIHLSAAVAAQSLSGTASLKTSNIDLRTARPWIKPYAKIELLSAFLDSDLKADFKLQDQLALDASGALQVRQLHVRDPAQNRDLLKWQALHLELLALKQAPAGSSLRIGRIRALQPYARLIINENLETNINQILVPQPEAPATTSKSSGPDFAFAIGEILVENGSANFADYSLQPHFATAIQKLNGRIGTLASNSNKATPVKITGAVDNYAPVSIHGSLTPFDPLQQLDITTEFKRVELTALTPYSGKFAGYRIQKGRLNMELHYQINQGQLDASNSVLLEQLQLGEKVSSEDAVDLPLKLAVAMLKDTKGNISIQLPVKGDLNSPEFSVMPIVWQTLRNLLTRAVTSPFKMLAGIGKAGGKDLGQVPFAAGSAQLDASAATTLDSLAQALQERPMLKLNIEGTSSASLDGPALAERMLHRRYQEMLYRQLQERGKSLPDDIYSLEVSERAQNKLLEQLYQSMLEQGQVATMPSMPRKERDDWQRNQVLAQMASDPALLRWLAQQRAAIIRSHLVEQGGVNVERLYLVDVNEKSEANGGHISSLLHLDVL